MGRTPTTRYVLTLTTLVVGLAAVIATTAWRTLPTIEATLSDAATEALDVADLPFVVDVSGRDVRLSGVAIHAEQVTEAEVLIASISGVRAVDLDGVVLAVAPLAHPQINLAFDGSRLSLTGTAPAHEATDALVEAAVAQFGVDQVDDSLTREPSVGAFAWFHRLSAVFALLEGWDEGVLTATAEGIAITGLSATEAAGRELAARVADVVQVDVTYQLGVVAVGTPSLEMSVTEDRVVVAGAMPSAPDISRVLEAVGGLRPDLTQAITLATVEPPAWLDLAVDLIGELRTWTDWGLRIDESGGEVWGFASSTADLERVRDELLADAGFDTARLEVTSEGLASEISQLIARSVSFRNGSADLDRDSRFVLNDVAEILLANPSSSFVVEGYTDNQGRSFDNLRLSHERAEAVVDYLIARGVGESRLQAIGYGESRPVASNDTPEGREWNRRIEFSAGLTA